MTKQYSHLVCALHQRFFSVVADTLEWTALQQGMSVILHYLDDILTAGRASSEECKNNLETIKGLCAFLRIRFKTEKIEGPVPVITFLGIVLDTIKQELCLPSQKLEELKSLVSECTKRELLHLIGKLAHVTKVVVPGHTFYGG